MATFDAGRLDGAQYNLTSALHAVRLQNTCEDFMDIVRSNPNYLGLYPHLVSHFCRLLDHDQTFPLAASVVPELRLPQSYDTSENTIINNILREPGIQRRRPQPAAEDPNSGPERQLIRRQTRAMLMYLEYDRDREAAATQEELDDVQNLADRVVAITSECLLPIIDNSR